MPNATRVVLAVGALVVCALVHMAEARPQAGKNPAARALGDAYRALEDQDFRAAYETAVRIPRKRLDNADYALYVLAQSSSLLGKHREALGYFGELARMSGSRFQDMARWRMVDSLWSLGRFQEAQRAYRKLVTAAADKRAKGGDLGLAEFRIADADARAKKRASAIKAFRAFVRARPAHPLAREAEQRLFELGGEEAARLTVADRLARAQRLTEDHLWHESIAELALIGNESDPDLVRERDYWTGMTLFRMRRRYKDASDILLRIYKNMGDRAAMALFHGARALSRADFDADAVRWYLRVVAEYPRTRWASEAQFLAGWLEFNMGNYSAAIPQLEALLSRHGKSRWALDGQWFLGFSHYRLGHHEKALAHFGELSQRREPLEGGKGQYWHGRALQKLGRTGEANQDYRALVGRFPWSWYAHLARARLAEQGIDIGPFGDRAGNADRVPLLDRQIDASMAGDALIRVADELIAAGLDVEAGVELRRGEAAFLQRHKKRSAALAMLMDRYRRAGNFNRPWMLAVVHGGSRALDTPPTGRARVWWEHAYPLAYRELIERWRHLGENPTYYLYAIMRKESGFDPHTLSYADAMGLLQMIPATTRRVVEHLGMTYTSDLLYDPELNIKTGSWYIGRMLQKFKGQVPFGAGAFNSGPRPVMRWMDEFGDLPVDEFVEMVPYRQTREYMKKVTENYSRYLYLYEGIVYNQPLAVDRHYLRDELTY